MQSYALEDVIPCILKQKPKNPNKSTNLDTFTCNAFGMGSGCCSGGFLRNDDKYLCVKSDGSNAVDNLCKVPCVLPCDKQQSTYSPYLSGNVNNAQTYQDNLNLLNRVMKPPFNSFQDYYDKFTRKFGGNYTNISYIDDKTLVAYFGDNQQTAVKATLQKMPSPSHPFRYTVGHA